MIFESEKSVMKFNTMYPNDNISVAICGSTFSNTQKKILLELGVKEIIIGLDRQYKNENSEEAMKWRNKILKMSENLLGYCRVSYIWDNDENRCLDYKSSPVDHKRDKFEYLVKNRIFVN